MPARLRRTEPDSAALALPDTVRAAAAVAPSSRDLREPASARISRALFVVMTLAALGAGWAVAERRMFTAEEGTGYWLGILGGSLLLAQLLYPLRKRGRFMRRLGSAPVWFRLHMVLGIVAPVLILWHCNFTLGDTNSNVTLFVMLTVALSGIVGRYLYGQLHRGLYGARTSVQELLADQSLLLRGVEADAGGGSGAIARDLTRYAESVLAPRRSLFGNTLRAISTAVGTPLERLRFRRAIDGVIAGNAARLGWTRAEQRQHRKAARHQLDLYLGAAVRAANLAFYDRLFGLWHVLHMPLFCLLVVTGIVHVVAVHLY